MLRTFDVKEREEGWGSIFERVSVLFESLLAKFCRENNLVVWWHDSIATTFNFNGLTLREKVEVLRALLEVLVNDEGKGVMRETEPRDPSHALLARVMCVLTQSGHRTLGVRLLDSVVAMHGGLTEKAKQKLELIVFNGVWSPAEVVMVLSCLPLSHPDIAEAVVQKALTFGLAAETVCELTRVNEPETLLRDLDTFVMGEADSSLQELILEMKNMGHALKTLELVENSVGPVAEKVAKSRVSVDSVQKCKQLVAKLDFVRDPNAADVGVILEAMCAAVHRATGKRFGAGLAFYPRVSQLVALTTLLATKTPDLSGCLLEIATGEGKSCIVAMLATVLALSGKKVDVLTNSPLLASRDMEEWRPLFQQFNLTASTAVPPKLDQCKTKKERIKKQQESYQANIVYGTISEFAADVLRQEFERDEVRGTRGFDVVIVDEVDYLTLDNGVQVTYLSHSVAGMKHLEPLLAAIWALTCTCRPIAEALSETDGVVEVLWGTQLQHFHKAVCTAVVGAHSQQNFSALDLLEAGVELDLLDRADVDELKQHEDGTQEAIPAVLEKIMSSLGPEEQVQMLEVLQKALRGSVKLSYFTQGEHGGLVPLSQELEEEEEEEADPAAVEVQLLLLDKGLACELLTEEDLVQGVQTAITGKMRFSDEKGACDNIKDKAHGILMPAFLRPYVRHSLPKFIRNALRAVTMSRDREYMIFRPPIDNELVTDIEVQQTDSIIPVDFRATGIMEKNKRWGDGLQQFLEMKHQVAVSPMATVTNFLSNYHFFQRYSSAGGIFGVTGTLGEESDVMFLARHFRTSCFSFPTHRRKKLVELPHLQVAGKREWLRAICACVKTVCSPKAPLGGQALLLLCEDMKTADEVKKSLLESNTCEQSQITMYTNSDKHSVEDRCFGSGDVIIATNLGGRGTDISVSDSVNLSGGLFVLLTHLAENKRVEKQAFGRTARKGRPGMVQMILDSHALPEAYQGQPVEVVRERRAEHESQRIQDMEESRLKSVHLQNQLFQRFCEKLGEFSDNYSKDEKEMKAGRIEKKFDHKPALNALKETWANWLILHEDAIEGSDANFQKLQASLDVEFDRKARDLLQGDSQNPYDFIHQAVSRATVGREGQKQDWERVADTDPSLKAVALYNKAFHVINEGDLGHAICCLEEAKKAVDIYVMETYGTQTYAHMSTTSGFDPHHDGVTNLIRQQEARNNLLQLWVESMDKAIDKLKELKEGGDKAQTKTADVFSLSADRDELGMIKGTFSWAEWAINKAISFGLSLLTAGVSAVKRAVSAVGKAVSALVKGNKVLIQVAKRVKQAAAVVKSAAEAAARAGWVVVNPVMQAGKTAVGAAGKAVPGAVKRGMHGAARFVAKSGASAWSAGKTGANKLVPEVVMKNAQKVFQNQAVKEVGKVVVKEVVEQVGDKLLKEGLDQLLREIFEGIENEVRDKIRQYMKNNPRLKECLVQLIVERAVPKSCTSESANYQIKPDSQRNVTICVFAHADKIFAEMASDQKNHTEITSRFQECKSALNKMVEKGGSPGLVKAWSAVNSLADLGVKVSHLTEAVRAIPCEKFLEERFVQKFIQAVEKDLQTPGTRPDARWKYPSVQELAQTIQEKMADKAVKEMLAVMKGHVKVMVSPYVKVKVVKGVGKSIGLRMRALNGSETEDGEVPTHRNSAQGPDWDTEADSLKVPSEGSIENVLNFAEELPAAHRTRCGQGWTSASLSALNTGVNAVKSAAAFVLGPWRQPRAPNTPQTESSTSTSDQQQSRASASSGSEEFPTGSPADDIPVEGRAQIPHPTGSPPERIPVEGRAQTPHPTGSPADRIPLEARTQSIAESVCLKALTHSKALDGKGTFPHTLMPAWGSPHNICISPAPKIQTQSWHQPPIYKRTNHNF